MAHEPSDPVLVTIPHLQIGFAPMGLSEVDGRLFEILHAEVVEVVLLGSTGNLESFQPIAEAHGDHAWALRNSGQNGCALSFWDLPDASLLYISFHFRFFGHGFDHGLGMNLTALC